MSKGILARMVNYTKKWWLLGCHYRAELLYSTNGTNDGNPVRISRALFIIGNLPEHIRTDT